jgi:hypothetical protein
LLLVNRHPANAAALGDGMLVLSLACLILWLLAIRPKGEILTTVTGHRWNPAETEHLLGQLDAINERLGRWREDAF